MATTNFESFAKLKKDLLFHERRMQLLLATRVVEDLGSNLLEKALSREECATDCRDAIKRFEAGAAEGRLTGRWDEVKVAGLFGLEVPLNVVIGSSKFEAPPENNGGIEELIDTVQSISQRFPEFSSHQGEAAAAVSEFKGLLKDAQWTPRDINRIREAIGAKLSVLTELDNLSNALQDSDYAIECERASFEELRRQEERADEDGEMALSDGILRKKMEVAEKMLDLHFFQLHTVESSIDSNVTRKKSNLTVFQGGAAMMDCIKGEKHSMVDGCVKDLQRITRGLEYEDKATGDIRLKTKRALEESLGRVQSLDQRQHQLADRLKDLFRDFTETELALEQVGVERAKAVQAHVELVEGSRHQTSDFLEMSRFAEVYQDNLTRTKAEFDKGILALEALEKVLLQQQDFDGYDFGASARRLNTVQRRVCLKLNRTLNEYESLGEDAVRRYTAKLRKLDDQLDVVMCELELKKEVFDPSTKKYTMKAETLKAERGALAAEIDRMRSQIANQREQCLEKIKRHLNSDEVVDVTENNATRTLRKTEDLLDIRQQSLLDQTTDVAIDRVRLAREREAFPSQASNAQKRQVSRVAALRKDVHSARDESQLTSPTAQTAPRIEDYPAPDATTPRGDTEAAEPSTSVLPDVSAIQESAADIDETTEEDIRAAAMDSRLTAIRANAQLIEDRTMTYRRKPRTIGSPTKAHGLD